MEHEKFNYFMQRTEKDLDDIKGKLDQLWSFRLMLLGAAMAVSTLFSVGTTLIVMFVNKGGK